MKDQGPDKLFASPLDRVNDFAFDEAVARVFPDMIQRSVPGYTTIIPMIGLITERYAQDHTTCYDLGCSLGASTLAMRHGLAGKQARIVGVDNSEAMIERCQHYIELDNEQAPVRLQCRDIREIEFEPCSVVTLNFTLQFIPLEDRAALLTRIAEALVPGGVLILSEKLRFDPAEQTEQEELHWLFKRANGYSDLEIAQKRSAIEKVLLPETLDTHHARLQAAGFARSFVWYQCFNFASMLAIK
ncbi:MAG: carboxy-S-adenosyl-L-methionine synthase CmoA [Oleiphilaceae bacterium]|nr:carboxy-S-adenosyl-L-methionine synthase CmoA [Oleiphilaceae bacterium]